jgi:hypothetical protein
MDIEVPEGFQYIDPTKLSIPAKTALLDQLKNTLTTLKEQDTRLYNFLISPDYKRAQLSNKEEIDAFENGVINKIQSKLNFVIETFKLIGMTGGGIFGFMSKSKTPSNDSNIELLIDNLEDSISGEKQKFNGMMTNIKLYVYTLEKDKQKAELMLELIYTKLATFNVIMDEIVSIIRKYQKSGGRKRKTHRRKQNKRRTKRRL